MKLTEEKIKRLEQIKKQISMEHEYRNNNFHYSLINDHKNNFGFTNIIFISIVSVIVVIILLILL